MPGGAAPKRKGTAGERLCMAYLEANGWYVTRSYASLGPWDVLAMRDGPRGCEAMMIQVKATATASLAPSERARLLAMAHRAGALPVACAVPHPYASATYEGMAWWLLTGPASRTPLLGV